MKRPSLMQLSLIIVLLALTHLQLATPLSVTEQWQAYWQPQPTHIEQIIFLNADLPRTLLAILLGAAMALSGSLLQQLTQNPLASPMTLGISAGAWCAIVLGGILLPQMPIPIEWLAMIGSLVALGLLGTLAGWRQLHSLSALLAGTALNLLLGSIAGIAVMLNDQYSRSLLVWGAGDLAQNDSHWLSWVCIRLLPALLILPWLCRPLQLLQLGSHAAAAAGLNVLRLAIITSLLALWLNGLAISAVGLIGFISLLAPALARLLGARSPAEQMKYSALLGMMTLLLADTLAMYASQVLPDILPSSAAAGLLGAPLLIYLCLRQPLAEGGELVSPPARSRRKLPLLLCLAVGVVVLVLCAIIGRDGMGQWVWSWPEAQLWSLRWPRLLAACAAGVGLAIAGLILQRLFNNPLASPDLLGISSGASLGMLAGLALGASASQWWFSAGGAALILLLLCWLAPRQTPARLILLGIGLSSLLEAVLQFVMAQGNNDSFQLLNWLAGSSYHTSANQALLLSGLVILLGLFTLPASRVLTLLLLGESHARSNGLNVQRTRWLLLLLAGGISLVISSQFGPMAFIGLVLPQLAIKLGARRIHSQLCLASLLGAVMLGLADLASRTVFFPAQIPVGALGSLACGCLLLLALLARSRSQHA
ncbi:Fe(3+)-hydroxamate ABC transporter permease FhuB [uncultured Deefgea sp.]|uniref:Fe(3+)-hydroxamate ABC transporter permease FhuB n=1 Tax=uncultured Deefgea sp. TaxID=1304914 RepID=UPI00260C47C6|nr:Fe(3+)-hydroxamate ABC transporter permease FhuB [uncultured Deefgea sp.]